MNPVRQLLRNTLTAVLPKDRWLVRGERRAPDAPPVFSLTFDDGPHPEHTPPLLDALDRWGVTATFFVVGRQVERHPELVERIVAAGHTLGNHTYAHDEPRNVSAETLLAEIAQTDRALSAWLDEPTRWVRPPKGELTWAKLAGLWRTGRTIALWNVDPRDYRMTTIDQGIAWARSYCPRHGDIVLLHDRFPTAAPIVDALGEAGLLAAWRCEPLDHWLSVPTTCVTGASD
jgi:peptidoglycan-N-acetylglucosamine deacetylase